MGRHADGLAILLPRVSRNADPLRTFLSLGHPVSPPLMRKIGRNAASYHDRFYPTSCTEQMFGHKSRVTAGPQLAQPHAYRLSEGLVPRAVSFLLLLGTKPDEEDARSEPTGLRARGRAKASAGTAHRFGRRQLCPRGRIGARPSSQNPIGEVFAPLVDEVLIPDCVLTELLVDE
jgi:hypothetical protein